MEPLEELAQWVNSFEAQPAQPLSPHHDDPTDFLTGGPQEPQNAHVPPPDVKPKFDDQGNREAGFFKRLFGRMKRKPRTADAESTAQWLQEKAKEIALEQGNAQAVEWLRQMGEKTQLPPWMLMRIVQDISPRSLLEKSKGLPRDHVLEWDPGTYGRGIFINDRLHTWPVDRTRSDPTGGLMHGEYLKQYGVGKGGAYPTSRGFEIDPGGKVFGADSHKMMNDILSIDDRLHPDPLLAIHQPTQSKTRSKADGEYADKTKPFGQSTTGDECHWASLQHPKPKPPPKRKEKTPRSIQDQYEEQKEDWYSSDEGQLTPGKREIQQMPWRFERNPDAVVRKASEDELHVALEIPQKVKDEIRKWADEQDWPEGTKLEDKDEYHVTLLYAPEGHEEHSDEDWFLHTDGYDVEVTGIDEFGEGDEVALVLRLDAPEAAAHAEDLQDLAENRDLEISRFPGGYKPHLTIAYGPHKPKYLRSPKLKFRTGPSSVSEPRYSWSGDFHVDAPTDSPGPSLPVTGPGAGIDPYRCSNCGGRLSEPRPFSTGKYFQQCESCGRSQRLPVSHPLAQEPPRKPRVLAKETLPQQQRRWHQIWDEHGFNEPDTQPNEIHRWDDGWHIYEHPTANHVNAVGKMMNNCWQSTKPEHLEQQQYEGWQYHSLHDPLGIPRAAWFVHDDPWDNGGPVLHAALGARNEAVGTENRHRIQGWANEVGVTPKPRAFAPQQQELRAQIGQPEQI